MNVEAKAQRLGAEDGQLVDLVTAALVDPNLHTDTRMRISKEITELLRATHDDQYGPNGRAVFRASFLSLLFYVHGVTFPSLRAASRSRRVSAAAISCLVRSTTSMLTEIASMPQPTSSSAYSGYTDGAWPQIEV